MFEKNRQFFIFFLSGLRTVQTSPLVPEKSRGSFKVIDVEVVGGN
jgi:hypothetical protein